jgi:hypothetical protein
MSFSSQPRWETSSSSADRDLAMSSSWYHGGRGKSPRGQPRVVEHGELYGGLAGLSSGTSQTRIAPRAGSDGMGARNSAGRVRAKNLMLAMSFLVNSTEE